MSAKIEMKALVDKHRNMLKEMSKEWKQIRRTQTKNKKSPDYTFYKNRCTAAIDDLEDACFNLARIDLES
jgi:hypothetical protein